MILLTENTNLNTNAENIFSHRFIKDGEAVGIYLSKFYATTEKLIATLLYHKHNVTLKYKDKTYILNNIEEWRVTIQDPQDQIKEITVKHPLKQMFDDAKKEYITTQTQKKLKEEYLRFQVDVPKDEVDSLLRAFAPLYEIDIDFTDRIECNKAYSQIQYYLENDIEYANEIPGIPPEDTPFAGMFSSTKPTQYDTGVEIIPVGNAELLEDLHYKCKHATVLLDNVISEMI